MSGTEPIEIRNPTITYNQVFWRQPFPQGPTGPTGAGSTGPTGPYNIEELTLIVKNDSGVQIDKGMAVMAVSAVGDRIRVARATNTGTISAEYYLGIALANIPDGSEGEVMVFGNIGQLDTSSYVIGDLLYLSPTTPGQLTKTKPTSPSIDLSVAIVTRVQMSSGRIFARFWSMGQKVSQLYDTIISGPTGGNMLVYENGIWGNTGAIRATSIINADGYTGGNMFLVGDLSLTGRLANTSDALEIGFQSGQTSQGASAIAIGNSAGQTSQGISAVSIGLQAGQTSQNTGCVAIGTTAGRTAQGTGAIALGNSAGQTTQGADGVAIGRLSGVSSQGTSCVAVGLQAGRANQGVNAVAIGSSAGFTGQGSGAVAIGVSSGITAQGSNAIGIGNSAGRVSQNNNCVAIGTSGGQLNQGINAIAIGAFAGLNTQGANSVAMGFQCGLTGQSINSVAIGTLAGQTLQSSSSVAIGINAGNSSQSSSSVAVGIQAGQTSQNTASVAIGDRAGNNTQGSRCIAIGLQAGATTQSANSVAVGANAGQVTQGANSVAIGVLSGQLSQNASAVAIGYNAGNNAQGTNAVAIGTSAGLTGQHANTIIINAQGTALNSDGIDRTFIAPIRNTGTAFNLFYNSGSKEVTYQYPSTPLFLGEKTTLVVNDSTATKIAFNTTNTTIHEDTLGWHSTSIDPTRVTPNVAGIYLVTFAADLNNGASQTITRAVASIFKNGVNKSSSFLQLNTAVGTIYGFNCSLTINMNGTTDYFECEVFQDTADATETWEDMWFGVSLLRAT